MMWRSLAHWLELLQEIFSMTGEKLTWHTPSLESSGDGDGSPVGILSIYQSTGARTAYGTIYTVRELHVGVELTSPPRHAGFFV